MKTLPDGLEAYRRTPEFTEDSVPGGLLKDHRTKDGVWGVIRVLSGSLGYVIPSAGERHELVPGRDGIVEPTVPHRVAVTGPVRFFVEFWREAPML